MALLSGIDIDAELISNHFVVEQEALLKDPIVGQVMEILGVADFVQEGGLPLIPGPDGIVFDVDSYTNPCSRLMRSRIAEKSGIKYKVVDPLSWSASEDKKAYLDALVVSDQVFGMTSSIQTGGDIQRIDPEAPKTPFFGYIRKIDLK
jgi:hypothetical protein